jgi:cell division protein FtsN
MKKQQRGGTILGLIFGMIIGLGAALAVAVYVTKVPVPFLNKGGKTVDRDAAEAERNRNWDPNAPLQSKAPMPAPATPATAPGTAEQAPSTAQPPAAVAGGTAATPAAPAPGAAKPSSTDPLGDLVRQRSAAADKADKARADKDKAAQVAQAGQAGESGFNYFVQAGAFRRQNEAEAQRAKLAMLGWEARLSEREQNGITVFRVRVGPFTKRDDAEQLKSKLDGAGVDSTLVRAAR